MADAPVAAPAAVREAPQGAAQRQPAAPERHRQRPRRRAAGHREEGPSAAATDRRPRRAPVRLVQEQIMTTTEAVVVERYALIHALRTAIRVYRKDARGFRDIGNVKEASRFRSEERRVGKEWRSR